MKILLVCAAGLSTSLLKVEMLQNSEAGTCIDTCSYYELEERIDAFDVILVAPQMGHHLDRIKKTAREHQRVAGGIEPLAYGRRLGRQVYEQAKQLYQEQKAGRDDDR